MKKFIRVCLIAGIILMAAGTAVMTSAFVLGANPVRIGKYTEKRYNLWDQADAWAKRVYGETSDVRAVGEAVRKAVEESMDEALEETMEEFDVSYPAVKTLSIRQEGGTAAVYASGDRTEAAVKGRGASLQDVAYDFSEDRGHLDIRVRDGAEYEIYLPADWTLSSLEAKVESGSFFAWGVRAEEAEYETRNGDMTVEQEYGAEVELECTGGNLQWTSTGGMAKELEADCKNGEILIGISGGGPFEASYELEWKDGNISLPSGAYMGNGETSLKGADGAPRLTLEAERGTITVSE